MRIVNFLKNVTILMLASLFGILAGFSSMEIHSHWAHPIFYRYHGDKNIFTQLVKEEGIDNPRKLEKWLNNNFEYTLDEEVYSKSEYWQTPLETLKLKTGDCEYFAFLSQ